ncbi:alpha/beta hydrolase [Amycolatopsis acidicola]|uniref:Alpha/beta hydrolase n=1 Tax=Amycolatopsis acidicola TaxID=2596893 RepID=A0A5N0UKP5_9PSEU|nr:alpha/beta hydrolase [Amycolatopsis acidicola]KAA9149458.1 alpha/beta hydrolase [Amycolatopsis acidicola]
MHYLGAAALRAATWGLVRGRERVAPLVPVCPSRSYQVIADDGTELYAEASGDPAAPVTYVLCHGYALTSASWCFQRAALSAHARVVTWDQRGHGRSARGPATNATIDQLGRDLLSVLEQTCQGGPVVLAGHSMGGMTVMALAEARPDLFGDPVTAVALLATTAAPVARDPLQGLAHRLGPAALAGLSRVPGVLRVGPVRELTRSLVSWHGFSGAADAGLTDFLLEMIESVPLEVLGDFLPCFRQHDKRAALSVLGNVDCLVMAGAADTITPCGESEMIAAAVPSARLVVLPSAGHAFLLEQPGEVNAQLLRLGGDFARLRTA